MADSQTIQTPGYEDFLYYYGKLQDLRRNRTVDTQLFMDYVLRCNLYIESLSDYEYNYLSTHFLEMADMFDVVKDLYKKIRNAVHESVNALTGARNRENREFRAFLQNIRAHNHEVLGDMAAKLNITAMTLSAMENMRKEIPDSFVEELATLYHLSDAQKTRLQVLVENQNASFRLGNNS